MLYVNSCELCYFILNHVIIIIIIKILDVSPCHYFLENSVSAYPIPVSVSGYCRRQHAWSLPAVRRDRVGYGRDRV
jgi:hypothetical protein